MTSKQTEISTLRIRLRRFYGSHLLHLVTMTTGFALAGYIVFTFNPATLWNPRTWWQSIATWLAAAIVLHDLALFPLYALADRALSGTARRRRREQSRVPALNHVRIPALASGLTLLIFWPGIFRQGSVTYLAGTGQTQQPFLGRWLLLTAAMFLISAVCYSVRLLLVHIRIAVDSNPTEANRPATPHSFAAPVHARRRKN